MSVRNAYQLALVLLVLLLGQARGGDQPTYLSLPTDEARQLEYFTDLPLLTHRGAKVKFYSDMLKNKTVALNFIFTRCSNVCPALTKTFAQLQRELGARLGKDVYLISISVDPERDTPEVLTRYASEYGAGSGWTFLTGKKENIDWVLHKLGQWNENFEAHSPLIFVANVKAGRWQALRSDASPQELYAQVQKLSLP